MTPLFVERFPAGDTKIPVRRRERRCGGLTAAALLTAARMGGSCAYAGTLGRDELSAFVIDELDRAGVDVANVLSVDDTGPVHAVVVIGEQDHTRTIFHYRSGQPGAHDSHPPPALIESARVLFVDTWGLAGQLRAARIAHNAGIPVVADFEHGEGPVFEELLALVDHLIVSQDFALTWDRQRHRAGGPVSSLDPAAGRRRHHRRRTGLLAAGRRRPASPARLSGSCCGYHRLRRRLPRRLGPGAGLGPARARMRAHRRRCRRAQGHAARADRRALTH